MEQPEHPPLNTRDFTSFLISPLGEKAPILFPMTLFMHL